MTKRSKTVNTSQVVPVQNGKPEKPNPDFPLFPHATKRWAKKIRGKMHYFGSWNDPQGALQKYLEQKDDLHAGRIPRVQGDGLTVRDLLNRFLTTKKNLVDTREITARTFADYHASCQRIGDCFGLTRLVSDLAADDFERLRMAIAKKWGPVALGNEIHRIRVVFKYGFDQGLIDKPVRYGQTFKRPSKKVLRKARNENGPRMFEAAEIQAMLASAGTQLKAMILLGINCGFGNTDCGTITFDAVNLETGWVNYPRPKTGIPRRAPLWAETIDALKEAIAKRPKPKNETDSKLVFITQKGWRWAKDTCENPVTKETRKLLDSIGINGHRNFYALRHTFETVAGESRDQVAVDAIMGHARDDMASVYRERISDERLRAVTDFVYSWLFHKSETVK
jgi:integrase